MPNHLASETSPYLLQHVNNPVDWYPWGDDALSLAKKLERPIFLSIGYSACHWCHVMEHESFENAEIAELMNRWFVCIKVDREERPDLDQIYMNAVQAMTGSGGWPMSVFLTPDQKPFYGGTYWPPTARWGRPGFQEILAGVHDAWLNRRIAVNAQADELTQHVRSAAAVSVTTSPLNEELLRKAMASILRAADRVHGGFGSAPKFPHPMDIRLGMRCWKRFGDGRLATHDADRTGGPITSTGTGKRSGRSSDVSSVLDVVTLTLDKMSRGGIYDHLGGGFARYSTDERWLVPHFEKMLYDNAQLVPAYLEAFQITGREDYSRVARETLDYVLREMTQPQGGFYSTQDADSEGVEGKFFVWSESEIDALLDGAIVNSAGSSVSRSSVFKHCYNVTPHGNWEHTNILNCPATGLEAAAELNIEPGELEAVLAGCCKRLFDERSRRVWPGRDDKVLVSWNGLMIAAMAMGANVLGERKYAEAASAAADFILGTMIGKGSSSTDPEMNSSGEVLSGTAPDQPAGNVAEVFAEPSAQLFHCYKDGRSRFNAYLDDYAALIDGLCELYQSVFDAKYLEAALKLADRMIDQFWDSDAGGFFYTSLDHESLIARNKETQDNATPSGNSLAAMGLLKLARLTGRTDLEAKAVATLNAVSGQLERIPLSASLSLMALDFLLGPTHEIVFAATNPVNVTESHARIPMIGQEFDATAQRMNRRFIPNKVVHWRDPGASDDELSAAISAPLRGKVSRQGQVTAYVCQHGVCGPPIVGEQNLNTMIDQM